MPKKTVVQDKDLYVVKNERGEYKNKWGKWTERRPSCVVTLQEAKDIVTRLQSWQNRSDA